MSNSEFVGDYEYVHYFVIKYLATLNGKIGERWGGGFLFW